MPLHTRRGSVASDAWKSSASGLLQALESLPGAPSPLPLLLPLPLRLLRCSQPLMQQQRP